MEHRPGDTASRTTRTVAAGLLLVGALVWLLTRGASTGGVLPRADLADPGSAEAAAGSEEAARSARWQKRHAAPEARAKRDALRDQILRALANPPPVNPAPAERPAGSAEGNRDPGPPGTLRDRLGGRDALLRALNRDFMPLAHECITEAQRKNPRLSGLLALGLETAADRELGAVVEAADPTAQSGIEDRELLECIRESALSLRLPPPPTSGREKFELTLPIEPDGDNADSRKGRGAERVSDGG